MAAKIGHDNDEPGSKDSLHHESFSLVALLYNEEEEKNQSFLASKWRPEVNTILGSDMFGIRE